MEGLGLIETPITKSPSLGDKEEPESVSLPSQPSSDYLLYLVLLCARDHPVHTVILTQYPKPPYEYTCPHFVDEETNSEFHNFSEMGQLAK